MGAPCDCIYLHLEGDLLISIIFYLYTDYTNYTTGMKEDAENRITMLLIRRINKRTSPCCKTNRVFL
ncbi:hypothetical protein [Paenibacillus sp.]